MNYTIGIVGNGRFGGLLYTTFLAHSDNFHPKLFSRSATIDNQKFFTIDEICECDIVIPTVPISSFEEQIKDIKPKLKDDCLLIDVCSVNVFPNEVMKKEIRQSVDIMSTHPIFGPDSTKNGTFFEGLNFVFHKTRVSNEQRSTEFLDFWKNLGCNMIEMSPEEHDKQAAYTHAFAFLVGKIGMKLGVRKNILSTKGFEGLLYNQEAVENDTGQLFDDMMRYNSFASEMRKSFAKVLEEIENDLRQDI